MNASEREQLRQLTAKMRVLRDEIRVGAIPGREPDRLGDAIRELARQMEEHGTERCRIGVRTGSHVTIFELRRIGETERWERGDSLDRTLRLGGVLVVDPR